MVSRNGPKGGSLSVFNFVASIFLLCFIIYKYLRFREDRYDGRGSGRYDGGYHDRYDRPHDMYNAGGGGYGRGRGGGNYCCYLITKEMVSISLFVIIYMS